MTDLAENFGLINMIYLFSIKVNEAKPMESRPPRGGGFDRGKDFQ